MKYVEFCKLCLSRPGKLKTKFDLNVLCIFSYVAFFILVPIGTDTLYPEKKKYKHFFSYSPNFAFLILGSGILFDSSWNSHL